MNQVPLQPEVEARLRELGEIDLLVGVPSFNNARTIAHVIRAITGGFTKYFPNLRAVCVNSDGGSTDGTPQTVAAADISNPGTLLVAHSLNPVHKILTPYQGIPGKGSAFRTIFAIAERLKARACAVVDSDLRSITPEWIELLLGPIILRNFDYVAPMYLRHKFDGTITNSIVYPLTRALYGKEVRQPIGGDFGFSGRLASHYLTKPVWETSVARFGIDIWMTTTAIADGFNVCQSFLGAKIHDAKDPGTDLSNMVMQVVSSVFDLMTTYEKKWAEVATAEEVPLFGFPHGVGLEPVAVNVDRMIGVFRTGVQNLREVWTGVIGPEQLAGIEELGKMEPRALVFPDPLWARTIYDFAVSYHLRLLPAEQLVRSLVPLYLGRTAAFILRNFESDAATVEADIRGLAEEFVRQKPYLRQRWSSRTRAKQEV